MSMINCINEKQRSKLLFELRNSIDCLDEMIPRLASAGASRDITSALLRAREQLHFEKRKAEDEIKKMEALKCEYRTTTALTVESSREKGM